MKPNMYKLLSHNPSTVNIIGTALHQGQPIKGVEKAPQALRKGGLHDIVKKLKWDNIIDHGDISYDSSKDPFFQNPTKLKDYKYHYINRCNEIGYVNGLLYNKVKESTKNGNFTLNIGGDHSCASGSITALKEVHKNLKIVWIDAHADFNKYTSPSLNYHGMPAGHCLGLMEKGSIPGFDWMTPNVNVEDIVFIGLRDIDDEERENFKAVEKKTGKSMKIYDIDDVTDLGIGRIMNEIKEYFNSSVPSTEVNNYPIHCSFDVDGCDPRYAPQTGTRARGGLSDREANFILRKLVSTKQLISMDLVEVNTDLYTEEEKDRVFYHGDWPEIKGTQTVCFALELIRSALGYKPCI